jgi:hypothetical protein
MPLLCMCVREHVACAGMDLQELDCCSYMPRTFTQRLIGRPHVSVTDVRIQRPGQSEKGKLFYSDYHKANTVKILVGINTEGKVVFVSTCKPGKISDKQITDVTGVLGFVPSGWKVMVDKGFLIDTLPVVNNLSLVIVRPPFASKHRQFTPQQAEEGELIAQARIHVERVNQRAKMFKILSHTVDNTCLPYVSTIVRVCFALTNLTGRIVIDTE